MSETVTYTSTGLGSTELDAAYERALARVRERFPARVRSLIDGRAVPGTRTIASVHPGDTRVVVAEVEESKPAAVDDAVEAARRAYRVWSRVPWRERVRLLKRVADRVERERLERAAVVAWETGKVRVEAVGEVDEAIRLLRYYGECYEENDGFLRPMGSDDERAESALRPYGVWGVISPFNFPLALAAGMLAGVLLGGNTAVFKPESATALSALLLTRDFLDELPAGCVQLIVGDGPDVGAAMVDHPGLDGFAFTGSREVGTASLARFQALRPRPFVAEMGGKNAVIVCPSADLEPAAAGIARSAFSFGGQKCSATSRVYVHESRAEELVVRLADHASRLVVGDPHEARTDLGPVINAVARDRFIAAVEEARRAGTVAAGGNLVGDRDRGFYVRPTVATGLPVEHPHLRHELFIPYVVVAPVTSLDEALREANAVPYGLTAGIFTNDEGERDRFLDEIEAGTVYVNRARGATTGAWPGVQPFGGWKESGSSGRLALGPRYVEQFMREQSRTVAE